jgi:hypothetical protein
MNDENNFKVDVVNDVIQITSESSMSVQTSLIEALHIWFSHVISSIDFNNDDGILTTEFESIDIPFPVSTTELDTWCQTNKLCAYSITNMCNDWMGNYQHW